ncbi:MAG TPA: flagellar motor switch phosphatase FliY [Halanaerobiales bacterium]|nr:flagellar motor switch phosphatase FliY [Halanaerobiales bacterium]HPZ63070.1 flagellar motor switch phosphatase FliY [Halanaerobiales bacterium]HQD04003.1 flagellar motor switch phosphatase FliY [Halanaerobiales bacterium]
MSNEEKKNILSQEEIDALFNTGEENNIGALDELSPEVIDVLGEIGNIAMGAAATALYSLLNQKVEITTPDVKASTIRAIADEYEKPCVLVQVEYIEGIEGLNLLIIEEEDAAVIADLMMGGDGSNPSLELDEIRLSAISEAMNQMMGSAATSMSSILNEVVNITPPVAKYIDLDDVVSEVNGYFGEDEVLVDNSFHLKVGDLIDSSFKQISKLDFANKLVSRLTEIDNGLLAKDWSINDDIVSDVKEEKERVKPEKERGEIPVSYGGNIAKSEEVNVKRAQFPDFDQGSSVAPLPQNMALIQDVPLQVTVRLGKTRMSIKEILELGEGSIVELDKLAGEPVDLLVNGKLVAKGEIVVIDENFGFRVKDIISPADRINNL